MSVYNDAVSSASLLMESRIVVVRDEVEGACP